MLEKWKNSYEKLYNPQEDFSGDANYREKCELLKCMETKLFEGGPADWCNVRISKGEIYGE